MRTNLLLALLLISATAYSQDSPIVKQSSLAYSNSFAAGILIDRDDDAIGGSLSVVNGVRLRRFHMGIGLGIDGYETWRFIPLYAALGYDIPLHNSNALFIQFNAGHSFGRQHVKDKDDRFQKFNDYGGLMINPLVGYKIAADKFNLFFACGYKLQKAGFDYSQGNWNYKTDVTFNRFLIQLGFGLH